MIEVLSDVVAVVRSYNDPKIVDFCQRLLDQVFQVVVVVPSNLDNGQTSRWIRAMDDPHRRIQVVQTLVRSGNDWSTMLNVGLATVRGLNAFCDEHDAIRYLMNVSNTTSFSDDHLIAMRSEFENNRRGLGVVGTTFAGYLADGTPEPLGQAYDHARNTGMMIDLRVFGSHPLLAGFDPRWDGAGGMEDYDFVGKMEALTQWRAKMLDLEVPLRIGRHRDQTEYVKMMEGGMAAVDAYHKEMGWR